MKKMKKESGITLIALIITIIVLIILVGVAISIITDEDSVFNGAKDAKDAYNAGKIQESNDLNNILSLLPAQIDITPNVEIINADDEYAKVTFTGTKNGEPLQFVNPNFATVEEYRTSVQEVLNRKTQAEKEAMIVKCEKEHYSSYYDERYPGQEITFQLILDDMEVTTLEELMQELGYSTIFEYFVSELSISELSIVEGSIVSQIYTENQIHSASTEEKEQMLLCGVNLQYETNYTLEELLDGYESAEDYVQRVCEEPSLEDCLIRLGYNRLLLNTNQNGAVILCTNDGEYKKVSVSEFELYDNTEYNFNIVEGQNVKNVKVNINELVRYNIERSEWYIALFDKNTGKETTFSEAYIIVNEQEYNISSLIEGYSNYSYFDADLALISDVIGMEDVLPDGNYTIKIVKNGSAIYNNLALSVPM